MIQSLQIKNFQSHKNTKLEFSEGVNVILGPSDSGKSAVMKALKWAINNRPSGDKICSWWGGETEVKVLTDEGTVTRSKDKTDEYRLSDPSGEYKDLVFKAFSLSVPEEISATLNLSEVNIQNQADAHFLISKTPGEVAAHFNKVARLDKIDIATNNVNSWLSHLKNDIGSIAVKGRASFGLIKQLADSKEGLEKFAYLQKMEIELEVLEELATQLKNIGTKIPTLTSLLKNIIATEEQIKEKSSLLKLEKPLDKVLSDIALRKLLGEEGNKLFKLIKEIKSTKQDLFESESILVLETPVAALLLLYKSKETLNQQLNQLNRAVNAVNNTNTQLKQKEAEFERIQTQFTDNFPDVCPLCGMQQTHKH